MGVLLAGLVWVAACATAPPQTAGEPGLPSHRTNPATAREQAEVVTQRRVDQLHDLLVNGQATETVGLPGDAQVKTAVVLDEKARALEAANRDTTLTGARALIALGLSDDAEAVLAALTGDPDVFVLSGRIAEHRRDWLTAMGIYESLPAGNLERSPSLLRAKLQWRSSNLPACAQQAIASPRLTRFELAILLVSMAPELEPAAGGSSPMLSDIVDLPCFSRALVVVRLGLLDIDRREHRFFPLRAARPEEVRSAVEGLCNVLDLRPPAWCGEAEAATSCTLISEPLRGQQVAEMVTKLVEAAK